MLMVQSKPLSLYQSIFFMKKNLFKVLAKINKVLLPSYSKQQLDLTKATKTQLAIIAWRTYVTLNAL